MLRVVPEESDLKSALQSFEKQYIQQVLRRSGQDKVAAARDLSIGLSSLYRKIDELGISTEETGKTAEAQD
jgi:transcriptional regulator with PAS, ATPase and Fis domain